MVSTSSSNSSDSSDSSDSSNCSIALIHVLQLFSFLFIFYIDLINYFASNCVFTSIILFQTLMFSNCQTMHQIKYKTKLRNNNSNKSNCFITKAQFGSNR